MTPPVTRHLTILLTDIKGFTDKTSRRSRSDIQALLDRHRELVLPVLEKGGGRLVKTIGDAFLMVYESPTDAVLAGIAVQDVLAKHNAAEPEDERIEVRIAINSGEVNLADNDVFGEPVNITARIESVAQAGEVFFTEAVYLAMNKTEVPSSEVGLLQLKGIPEKVRVYKVRRESPVGAGEPAPARSGGLLRAWSAPAGEQPKAAPVGGDARPPLWRRASALLIDAVLVGMLASTLTPGDREEVRVRYKLDAPKSDPLVQLSQGKVVTGEDGTKVQLGKDGLHVEADDGTKVTLSKAGIQVDAKDAKVALGKTGIRVDEKTAKTASAPGKLALSASVAKDDEAEDSATLYDKDGLSVRAGRRKKNVAFPLFWLFYSTLFLGLWRATPGKRVLKLAVARADGAPFEWKDAFVRSLFTLISGYALMVGYLWAFWERDRRGWHDLWAGTVVRGREAA